MARKRKEKGQKTSEDPQVLISEDEQWRIIEQSGILKNIQREETTTIKSSGIQETSAEDDVEEPLCSPLCEEIYNSILFIIPFSALYVMMDMSVSFRVPENPFINMRQIVWPTVSMLS